MHVRHLAYRVVGRVEDGKQFHQLGRLQIGDAQSEANGVRPLTSRPTPGISTSASSRKPATNSQGDQRCQVDQGHLKGDSRPPPADDQKDGMANQIVGRMIACHATASAMAIDAE
jgi:hypothetical protein